MYAALKISEDALYDIARRSAVLDLTKYEIGNAVLRESKVKTMDGGAACAAWQRLLHFFSVIEIDNMAEVCAIASDKRLTFYDASYVYLAEKQNLKLVTEDAELLESTKNAMNLRALKDSNPMK